MKPVSYILAIVLAAASFGAYAVEITNAHNYKGYTMYFDWGPVVNGKFVSKGGKQVVVCGKMSTIPLNVPDQSYYIRYLSTEGGCPGANAALSKGKGLPGQQSGQTFYSYHCVKDQPSAQYSVGSGSDAWTTTVGGVADCK